MIKRYIKVTQNELKNSKTGKVSATNQDSWSAARRRDRRVSDRSPTIEPYCSAVCVFFFGSLFHCGTDVSIFGEVS